MKKSKKEIRLSKAARDFNKSLDEIIKFLAKEGYKVEHKPNFMLSNEMYNLLVVEFGKFEIEEDTHDSLEETIRLGKAAHDFNKSLNEIIEFLEKEGYQVERNPDFMINNEMYLLLDFEFGEFDIEEDEPASPEKTIRLGKVARDFSKNIDEIIEFLEKEGYQVERNPDFMINNEMYLLLDIEFGDFDIEEDDPYAESNTYEETNDLTEYDEIFDLIINSAKAKFNYSTYAEQFAGLEEGFADKLLLMIISGFVINESKEVIAAKLFSEVIMQNLNWDRESANLFVSNKDELFKLEIFLMGLAVDMIKGGTDSTTILLTISKLLSKRESDNITK